MTARKTPPGLGVHGRRLWRSVSRGYVLAEVDGPLLLEMCRTVDNLQALAEVVSREGVTHDSPQGVRAHPALVEARQQRLALARLVAALGIPVDTP